MHKYEHEALRLLNVETNTCNSKSMALKRRIEEFESIIGVKACYDEATGKSLLWFLYIIALIYQNFQNYN